MSFLRSQTVLLRLIESDSFESEGALMLIVIWSSAGGSVEEEVVGACESESDISLDRMGRGIAVEWN